MRYVSTIHIPKGEFIRINDLMELDNLSEMSEEQLKVSGAEQEHWERVYDVRFMNGATLSYDLCSGMENYYDDVVWTSADGKRRIMMECTYELSDLVFTAPNDDVYIIALIVE